MSLSERFGSLDEEVSSAFVRRLHGEWGGVEEEAHVRRLGGDAAYAEAYGRAEEVALVLRDCADTPEMMRLREKAIAHARRAGVRRWVGPRGGWVRRWGWGAVAGLGALALAAAWQLSPYGYRPGQYHTGIGEQRVLELDDHSRVMLDAATRVAVRYSGESRTVELVEGQAQFSVARDPGRPFRVLAGDHAIVALGTVFTVDFTDRKLRVAMVDGRVEVVASGSGSPMNAGTGIPDRGAVELATGEELKVAKDGRSTVIPKADLEAATAWRNGKVVFRTERLADAVERMNRYSRVRIEIADQALGEETVSGVFEAGDTQGFVAGVRLALPVEVRYLDSGTVRLSLAGEK